MSRVNQIRIENENDVSSSVRSMVKKRSQDALSSSFKTVSSPRKALQSQTNLMRETMYGEMIGSMIESKITQKTIFDEDMDSLDSMDVALKMHLGSQSKINSPKTVAADVTTNGHKSSLRHTMESSNANFSTPEKGSLHTAAAAQNLPTKKSYSNGISQFKDELQTVICKEVANIVDASKASIKDAIITINIHQAKMIFSDSSKILTKGALRAKAIDLSTSLNFGYNFLHANDIVPPTLQEKMLKISSTHSRLSSAKNAPKVIDSDHKMFGEIYKIIQKLKDFSADAENYYFFIEEDLNARKDEFNTNLSLHGKNYEKIYGAKILEEIAEFSALANHIDKMNVLANLLLEYYNRYVVLVIEEFGSNSLYKGNFADEEEYIAAFADLVDAHGPLLVAEKRCSHCIQPPVTPHTKESIIKATTASQPETTISTINIVSAGGVFYKFMPTFCGLEFALNQLNNLFLTMQIQPIVPTQPLHASSSSSSSPMKARSSNNKSPPKSSSPKHKRTSSSTSSDGKFVSHTSTLSSTSSDKKPTSKTPPRTQSTEPSKVISTTAQKHQEIGKVINFQSQSEFTQENINRLILSSSILKRKKVNFLKVVDKSSRLTPNITNKNSNILSSRVAFYEWSPMFTTQNLNDVTVCEKHMQEISLKSFSALFLTCLLAEVAHVRAENISTSFIPSSKGKDTCSVNFTGFNVDLFLARCIFDSSPSSVHQMGDAFDGYNVLFKLPQMSSPLHVDVVNFLLQCKYMPEKIVCCWLRDLCMQNRKYETLVKTSGFTAEDMNNLKLPIRLPEKAAVLLYEKLMTVCKELKTNRQAVTHSSLLQHIYPPSSPSLSAGLDDALAMDMHSLVSISNNLYSITVDNVDQDSLHNNTSIPIDNRSPYSTSWDAPRHQKSASADENFFASTNYSPQSHSHLKGVSNYESYLAPAEISRDSFDSVTKSNRLSRSDVKNYMWNPHEPPSSREFSSSDRETASHTATPHNNTGVGGFSAFFRTRSFLGRSRTTTNNDSKSTTGKHSGLNSDFDIEENVGMKSFAMKASPGKSGFNTSKPSSNPVRHSRSHSSSGSYFFSDIYGNKKSSPTTKNSHSLASSSSRHSVVLYEDSPLKTKDVPTHSAVVVQHELLGPSRCSIERVGYLFVSKLDFSVIPTMEDNDFYSHIGSVCGMLTEVCLFNIDEIQLTFLFKDWLRIAIRLPEHGSREVILNGMELVTTDVVLVDLTRKQKEIMNCSKILADLHQLLHIKVSYRSSEMLGVTLSESAERFQAEKPQTNNDIENNSSNYSISHQQQHSSSDSSTGGSKSSTIRTPAMLQKTKMQVLDLISPRQAVPSSSSVFSFSANTNTTTGPRTNKTPHSDNRSNQYTTSNNSNQPVNRFVSSDITSEMDAPPKFWDINITNNSNNSNQNSQRKAQKSPAKESAVEISSPSRIQQKIYATENKQKNPLSLKAKGTNNHRMFSPVSPGRNIMTHIGSEATTTTTSNNHSFLDSNHPDDFYALDGELKDVDNIRHLDRIA